MLWHQTFFFWQTCKRGCFSSLKNILLPISVNEMIFCGFMCILNPCTSLSKFTKRKKTISKLWVKFIIRDCQKIFKFSYLMGLCAEVGAELWLEGYLQASKQASRPANMASIMANMVVRNVFVYGTLLAPEVVSALIHRAPTSSPALVHD